MSECSVPACRRKEYCRSFCAKHYHRIYRKKPENWAKHLAFGKSPRGREINKKAVAKYLKTDRAKKVRQTYQRGLGKDIHARASAKYHKSAKGQINQRLWNKGLTDSEKERARLAWSTFEGRCNCCGTENTTKKGWCLDHKDDRFRGILCQHCNCAAGHLQDDVIRCMKLAIYLRKTQ